MYITSKNFSPNTCICFEDNSINDIFERNKEYEKIMCKGTYTKKITDCLQELGIPSKKKEHFGRNTGPAIMDVEEVCGLDQRNMGNWAADVFQKNYSKRLPLGALRVLAGYSKERGYYKNTRTTFTGGHKYIEL